MIRESETEHDKQVIAVCVDFINEPLRLFYRIKFTMNKKALPFRNNSRYFAALFCFHDLDGAAVRTIHHFIINSGETLKKNVHAGPNSRHTVHYRREYPEISSKMQNILARPITA